MTKEEILRDFFNTALKGESKTYNDHNWYTTGNTLNGYIEGRNKNPYSLLKKPLSQYTIGEIKAFQSNPRNSVGQLWATGRYQIIPSTLIGIVSKAGLSDSDKYSKENQDKLGYQLMLERSAIKNYITGAVPDTTQNLQNAALHMSMIWSSIGVPFPTNGKQTNQSYYASDRASVDTKDVQNKLKELRGRLGGKLTEVTEFTKKNFKPLIIGFVIITLGVLLVVYRKNIADYLTKL